MKRLSLTFASSLLLLAACGPKLPEGAKRTDADADHHDFRLTPDKQAVLYIRGAYPRKTYLVKRKLDEKKEMTIRVPGRSLYGPIQVSPEGKYAYVNASTVNEQTSNEDGSTTVAFDLETGRSFEPASAPPKKEPDVDVPKDVKYVFQTSKRPTEVLGLRDGKLYVAVTAGPGASLWTLDLDEKRLPAYRDAIDNAKDSPLLSLVMGGAVLLLAGIIFILILDGTGGVRWG